MYFVLGAALSACTRPLRDARRRVKRAVDHAKNAWLELRFDDLNRDTDGRGGCRTYWAAADDLMRGLHKLPPRACPSDGLGGKL